MVTGVECTTSCVTRSFAKASFVRLVLVPLALRMDTEGIKSNPGTCIFFIPRLPGHVFEIRVPRVVEHIVVCFYFDIEFTRRFPGV